MVKNHPKPEASLSWEAYESNPKKVNYFWLPASLLFAIVLVVISIWQKNLLFAVFIILAEIVIILFSFESPRSSIFKVDAKGLKINSRFYFWDTFSGFSISPPSPDYEFVNLYFYSANHFSFNLKLKVKTSEVDKIKSFLHNYLDEVEPENSLIDSLADFLGF